jgi:hypothetical protein
LFGSIDPEQVRKLAGWGLTQNDIASFVGFSQFLISVGFSSSYDYRRRQLKTGLNKVMGRNLIACVSKTCGNRQADSG